MIISDTSVMNKSKTLTIVISTYNRRDLLLSNLKKMLTYKAEDFDIIIGDNASSDNTMEMLNSISDSRLYVFHNEKNYGIQNTVLLSEHVNSEFFLFLNDRDIIEEEELSSLISFLNKHQDCEIIASFGGGKFRREGYYTSVAFYDCYYMANHPGQLIYKTKFYKEIVNYKFFRQLIDTGNQITAGNYILYQQLLHLSKGFFRSKDSILQPINRDSSIKQVREELYGSAYVLPDFHIKYYSETGAYAIREHIDEITKIRKILLSCFAFGLYKVEVEYHYAVKSHFFRIRNQCEDAKSKDWFRNGVKYTRAVLHDKATIHFQIRSQIFYTFIWRSILNSCRVARDAIMKKTI